MDILDIIIRAIVKIATVFLRVGSAALDIAEEGLRGPLHQIGVTGIPATLIITLVPILSVVAAANLFRGIFRFAMVAALVLVTAHAAWPLIGEIQRISWSSLMPA